MGWVSTHRTALFTDLASTVMDGAGDRRVLLGVGVAAPTLVVARRAFRAASAGVVAVLLAVTVAGVLKHVVGRARPPASLSLVQVGGASMPSTHATWMAAASVAVLLVAVRHVPAGVRAVWIGAVAAGDVVVGVLMVYLGAHWPTDVVAGWALGAIIGALVALALGRHRLDEPRRGRPPETRRSDPYADHPLGRVESGRTEDRRNTPDATTS